MLTLGILCSGELGLEVLSKLDNDQCVTFVMTDRNSVGIANFSKSKNLPIFLGNPRGGKGFLFVRNYPVDVIISINYLFLIDSDIIHHSKKLTFNVHGSLLPKYRGRTPHVWAIINGEIKTGITAHLIDSGCDTGQIIRQVEIPINFDDTGASLLNKFKDLYYPLIQKVLWDIESNKLKLTTQSENNSTFFGKRTPNDGEIDWNWNSETIRNWVRAQAFPYPGAFTYYAKEKVIIDKVSIDKSNQSKETNGTIIGINPDILIKTSNGAVRLDKIRTTNHRFVVGKILGNEIRT